MDYKEEMEESLFALPEKQIVKVGRTVADECIGRGEALNPVSVSISAWVRDCKAVPRS